MQCPPSASSASAAARSAPSDGPRWFRVPKTGPRRHRTPHSGAFSPGDAAFRHRHRHRHRRAGVPHHRPFGFRVWPRPPPDVPSPADPSARPPMESATAADNSDKPNPCRRALSAHGKHTDNPGKHIHSTAWLFYWSRTRPTLPGRSPDRKQNRVQNSHGHA